MQLALRRAFAAGKRDAQVQHAPLPVVAQVQVGGLDVAVNDAEPVQATQRVGQRARRSDHVDHGRAVAGAQHLFQRTAGMPVEHGVQRAGVGPSRMHTHEAAALHAHAEPGLMGQHRALLGVVRARRVERLQRHQVLRLQVARLVQQVHAGVGDSRCDLVAVDHVAALECGGRFESPPVGQLVVEAARIDAAHAQHQRRGVVDGSRPQRAQHQRLACALRVRGLQAGGDARRLEHAVHAVAGQHEAIADTGLALHVVDADLRVQAHGARQAAAQVGVIEGVVGGQQLQLRRGVEFVGPAFGAQAPGARVAHMGQCPGLALQHQRGQRGERGAAFLARALATPVVIGQPGVLRADEAIEHDGGLPGVGRGEEVGQQAQHGGLRRLAAAAAVGHAVGDRRDHAARLRSGGRQRGAREIFVGAAQAALAGESDVDFEAHDHIVGSRTRAVGFALAFHASRCAKGTP